MGVDAPDIRNVIHITPPSRIESYVQEIGRAGPTGQLSSTTLYYNKSDISDNVKHMDKSIKEYRQSQNTCLRQQLLNYLGYQCTKQERYCCVCQDSSTGDQTAACNELVERMRFLTTANAIILQKLHQLEADNNTPNLMLMKSPIPPQNVLKKIITEIHNIKVESDLSHICGIWDEECSLKIFSLISTYAPLLQTCK